MSDTSNASAAAPAGAVVVERRAWVRYLGNLPAFCEPLSVKAARKPQLAWPVLVRNISAGGLNLSVHQPFEVGTSLFLEFPAEEEDPWQFLVARVVYAKPEAAGGWTLGCAFTSPLTEEEVQRLLRGVMALAAG